MIAAPLTSNSLAKLAAGITDTLPLGLLVEDNRTSGLENRWTLYARSRAVWPDDVNGHSMRVR
jgi:hypothetical protein